MINESLIRNLIRELINEVQLYGRTILPPKFVPSTIKTNKPINSLSQEDIEEKTLKDFTLMFDSWLKTNNNLNNNRNLSSGEIWTSFINDAQHQENRKFFDKNIETLNKRRSDISDLIRGKTKQLNEKNNKYFIWRSRS